MEQTLVILGSGTAVPTSRRGPTAELLVVGDDVTLIDPGPGAVQRACEAGYPVPSIERVLLTHHHPDHCLDVAALLFARKNRQLEGQCRPLRILGGPGTKDLLDRFLHLFGGWIRLPEGELEVIELAPGPFRLGERVEAHAVAIRHSPASLAYRFHLPDGASLAVSGDTDECDGAVEVARGVDHYLLEAAMPDGAKIEGHLTPTLAARIAAEAGCAHLVLNHFYPPVDVEQAAATARRLFPGRVTVAEDGLRVPLVREERRG